MGRTPLVVAMAKSKNHTNHNQIRKAHRNGIHKAKRFKKMSTTGMDCKFLRNQRHAKNGMSVSKEEKEEREKLQKEAQKKFEERAAEKKKKEKEDAIAEKERA